MFQALEHILEHARPLYTVRVVSLRSTLAREEHYSSMLPSFAALASTSSSAFMIRLRRRRSENTKARRRSRLTYSKSLLIACSSSDLYL